MKLFAQGATLDLTHPHVMGILNVTPDSFSDGGAHNTLIEAVKHANLMVNAGATIIDVGGESTRPGAAEVSVKKSWIALFRYWKQSRNVLKCGFLWIPLNPR
ncbi:dihydropteroate synthase [Salmonella enterica subsp. enterica]|nr:dihydropteroate synthase [Salmonella enterica subsp. enterica]